MSKQIAMWLPDDLIDFVDEIVGSGARSSRAAVVVRALERERRRAVAERDARILARTGPDPELQDLADHMARLPIALDLGRRSIWSDRAGRSGRVATG